MAVDVGEKLRRGELAVDHVAFELRHVDAVCGEAAKRLVKRGRHVAYSKNKSRDHGPVAARRVARRLRQDDETRRVMRLVLDVLAEIVEAVDIAGEPGGERGARLIGPFRHFARGAGGVAGDDRLHAELADDLAALAERMDVAFHGLDRLQCRAARRHQLVLHRQEIFGDDVQARFRHQVMDVGDAAGDRIVDRDHGERGAAGAHRRERVLEGRARQRLVAAIGLHAGDVRIGARLTLERDFFACRHVDFSWNMILSENRYPLFGIMLWLAWRARFPNPRAYRRRAARCRRWRRRCACRLRARGVARASRVARAATALE